MTYNKFINHLFNIELKTHYRHFGVRECQDYYNNGKEIYYN